MFSARAHLHNSPIPSERMASYSELRTLTSRGIGGKQLPEASAYLINAGLEAAEPSREIDDQLLAASIQTSSADPLLCLRCHISHPFEAWVRGIYGRFKDNYDLELTTLAGFALDDTGTARVKPRSHASLLPFTLKGLEDAPAGLLSPFSAEVLRTYEPTRCGLPHWARLKLQCHNELKAYLRQEGILLISDWALLADTSPKRIGESWDTCGDGAYSKEAQLALHRAYKPLYREAMAAYRSRSGKGSGWQPDAAFLHQLVSDQRPDDTMLQLKAMADAIRRLLSGRWISSSDGGESGWDAPDPASLASDENGDDGSDPQVLRQQIDAALQRAIDAFMPTEMAKETKKFAKTPERRMAWQLYGEGMSQREIGPRCNHQQAWVSKLLDEKRRSTAIATAAAMELKRQPNFIALMATVEGVERLVEALRNHLIEPEREGADAPLRRWVLQYLQQP